MSYFTRRLHWEIGGIVDSNGKTVISVGLDSGLNVDTMDVSEVLEKLADAWTFIEYIAENGGLPEGVRAAARSHLPKGKG